MKNTIKRTRFEAAERLAIPTVHVEERTKTAERMAIPTVNVESAKRRIPFRILLRKSRN